MTQPSITPNQTTTTLVELLIKRDSFGQKKYGTSLDRKDLKVSDWLQHQIEELLDGAGYAQAALREHLLMEQELINARRSAREYGLLLASLNTLRHNLTIKNGVTQEYRDGVQYAINELNRTLFAHDTGAILRQASK